jgi:type VI secretion system protein ImpA
MPGRTLERWQILKKRKPAGMAVDGIDLEEILAPISAEAPAGSDARQDFSPSSLYFRLRDARAEARQAERAADADPNADSGLLEGWRQVRTLAVKALREQTKDLEIAAWLTESLVRSDGLAGLAAGADIIAGLAERYWDTLYPMPDEDGISTKVGPVTGLNGEGGDGTLIQPLRKQKLFNDGNGAPVLLFQYDQSAELRSIEPKRAEARVAAGVVPFERMEAAARAAGAGALVALRRDLREAERAWGVMGQVLDGLAGADAPPTSRVRDVLARINAVIGLYAPAEVAAADPGANADAAAPDLADSGDAPAGNGAGAGVRKIRTREDALAILTELAGYFRRTEPQSPLAYTIDDAVRRARLTWPELLDELIADSAMRETILNNLGIKAGG